MGRFDPEGKVAVVTGASSGIGRALVRLLAGRGMRLGLIARGRQALEATAGEVRELGGEPVVLPGDVADPSFVKSAAEDVATRWETLDLWVNNAMVGVLGPSWEVSAEEFDRVTRVNYLGYVHGTLAALHHMRPRNEGLIVQVGTALAYRSIPLQSAYCASKAAVRGFTDSVRCELVHERCRVTLMMVQLPAVNTPQFDVMRNKMPRHSYPVPPHYQPELIAEAILHAIEHPRRERWIGLSTTEGIVGQKLFPGALDRYLGRNAWEGQQTGEIPPSGADNLDGPLPGDRGTHGSFDRQAKRSSGFIWAATHKGLVAGAAAGILAVAGLGYWLRSGGGSGR
jgi:NAD(P)-dependent dehydrogenase (short-subunit alcohol dehydrogenase family)